MATHPTPQGWTGFSSHWEVAKDGPKAKRKKVEVSHGCGPCSTINNFFQDRDGKVNFGKVLEFKTIIMKRIILKNNSKKRMVVIDAPITFSPWSGINWRRVDKSVNKLKQRIFLAKLNKADDAKIRRLQKTLIKSKANLLYSIRKVTCTNRGKKTAGVDKQVYLNPARRWALYQDLAKVDIPGWMPAPVRRIEIPRPGKARPLGIPNITDRVIQLVVKNALEPEWEAQFEHSSYGFRPSRRPHDAMVRIWRSMSSKSRVWVLDADIKGCFNNIAHTPLVNKLGDFPAKGLVERWLKAGYFMGDVFHPTEIGTPQGGIISPLLANIALHGMEKALGIRYHKGGYVSTACDFAVVRYADDFVVLCRTKEKALEAKALLEPWLKDRGMEFSPEKTNVTSFFDGVDFLGWTFRLHKTHKTKAQRWVRAKGEYTSIVIPSKKSVQAIKDKLKISFRKYIGRPASLLIREANSIIRGWCNYHKWVNSNQTFRSLDHFMYQQYVRFMKRRHAHKSWKWLLNKYIKTETNNRTKKTGIPTTYTSNWCFYEGQLTLTKFLGTSLENYSSIRYGSNPLNPADSTYFLERKSKGKFKKGSLIDKLVDTQKGFCPVCGGDLVRDDWDEPLHVHHLIHRKSGGDNKIDNLMVLHEECHISAHKRELTKQMLVDRLKALTG